MCKVMGIVNVTPDSFSDGGSYFKSEEAIRRVWNMVEEGADIIDIGAESTRPGSVPISWEEEWQRLEPVFKGLKDMGKDMGTVPKKLRKAMGTNPLIPISVDTYHPETARRAVAAGASIINCVYAEPIPEMLKIVAENPSIELVMPSSLWGRSPKEGAKEGGLSPLERIYIDPMIGFGTTREEDLELLKSIPELAKKGRVLVGASRKRIVKKLTGEKMLGKNIGGNLAIAVWCAMHGASVVRVHDVKETVQAIRVIEQLR